MPRSNPQGLLRIGSEPVKALRIVGLGVHEIVGPTNKGIEGKHPLPQAGQKKATCIKVGFTPPSENSFLIGLQW